MKERGAIKMTTNRIVFKQRDIGIGIECGIEWRTPKGNLRINRLNESRYFYVLFDKLQKYNPIYNNLHYFCIFKSLKDFNNYLRS
jgi:hypothetical protein